MCGPPSSGIRERSSRGRRAGWKRRWSPASRTTAARRRSRCCACPIGPASPPACSARSAPSRDGYTDISFTLPRGDFARATTALEEIARTIGAQGIVHDERVAKISIVGVGMRSHSGVAALMFGALSRENINIQMISTSEIAVSCVIEDKYTELAVRALHDAFALGREGV